MLPRSRKKGGGCWCAWLQEGKVPGRGPILALEGSVYIPDPSKEQSWTRGNQEGEVPRL